MFSKWWDNTLYQSNFFERVTAEFCNNHMTRGVELKDSLYCIQQEEAENVSEKILSTLSKDQRVLFRDYEEVENALTARAIELYYRLGFSDAMRLFMGAMSNGE